MKTSTLLLAMLLQWLTLPAAVAAYNLNWHTFGGGGERSTGGSYTLEGTIGEADANSAALREEHYQLQGGFWVAALPFFELFINDVIVKEGDNGTTSAQFTVTLKPAITSTVTVNYATADNTATAESDYVAISATPITFSPGDTSKTIEVTINSDQLYEGADETFLVNLLQAMGNARIVDNQGVATITEDDSLPSVTLSLSGSLLGEFNGNTLVTASLSNPSYQEVIVELSLSGTATELEDYTISSKTIIIPAGKTSATQTLSGQNDMEKEGPETIIIAIDKVTNGIKADGNQTIIASIADDESSPSLPDDTLIAGCLAKSIQFQEICNLNGETVSDDLEVLPNAQLSNAVIEKTLTNQGEISNLTITATGSVSGGTVTGVIKNNGLMANLVFVGESIIGGTLAGNITNSSTIGGYIQDVHLAADTHIKGGKLKGHIEGKEESPAWLEEVEIAPGSILANVIIGEQVKLASDVSLQRVMLAPGIRLTEGMVEDYLVGDADEPSWVEDNVTFVSDTFIDNVVIGDLVELPDYVTRGENVSFQAVQVDMGFQMVDTRTYFKEEIHLQGERQPNHVKLSQPKEVRFEVTITADSDHVGEPAQLLIVAGRKPSSEPNATYYYMRQGNAKWLHWDDDILEQLQPAQDLGPLPNKPFKVLIYDGDLSHLPGEFWVYVGYQLNKNKDIVFNGKELIHFLVEAQE